MAKKTSKHHSLLNNKLGSTTWICSATEIYLTALLRTSPPKQHLLLILWLSVHSLCPKTHISFLPSLLTHILFLMSCNRKQKVREIHFHHHWRVSLGTILSFLWRSLAWKEGEQSLKRCHQKMATATALKVSITTLTWYLALWQCSPNLFDGHLYHYNIYECTLPMFVYLLTNHVPVLLY